jgi:hypothetical protein
MSTVVFASGRAWVRSAFSGLERNHACQLLDPRLERIGNPGEKSAALTRSRARPGGKRFSRSFHRARYILGAAARHHGYRATVSWILDFELLARSAVDPFAANQHSFLPERSVVLALLRDSRHHYLHRFSCDLGPPQRALRPHFEDHVVFACVLCHL